MRKQGQPLVVIGVLIILASLALLIGNLLDIDVGVLCLPALLILAGIWLLARPYVVSPETALRFRVFGPIRRVGSWTVTDEETYFLRGDSHRRNRDPGLLSPGGHQDVGTRGRGRVHIVHGGHHGSAPIWGEARRILQPR